MTLNLFVVTHKPLLRKLPENHRYRIMNVFSQHPVLVRDALLITIVKDYIGDLNLLTLTITVHKLDLVLNGFVVLMQVRL